MVLWPALSGEAHERAGCLLRQAGTLIPPVSVPVRGLAQIAVRFWAPFLQLRGALSSRIGMFGVEGGQVSSTDIAQNAYVSSPQQSAQTLMPQGTAVADVAGNSPFCADLGCRAGCDSVLPRRSTNGQFELPKSARHFSCLSH